MDSTTVATGLRFPEGPIALPNGDVLVAEMFGQCLTRISPDGTKVEVASIPGGPNGAALGPGGHVFVCNNGGCYTEAEVNNLVVPAAAGLDNYLGGSIQRVDLDTGEVLDLYTECDGHPLRGPNDIVFDGLGGFYFTDSGVADGRTHRPGGIYYAKEDGSSVTELCFPVAHPNGIGLSPDGKTLYWAETYMGRVMKRSVVEPGVVSEPGFFDGSDCLYGFPGYTLLDSLAVDGDGNVCVTVIPPGGIAVVSPEGELLQQVETGDLITTNICFGGDDLTTAFITLSGTGRLVSTTWPRAGLALAHG